MGRRRRRSQGGTSSSSSAAFPPHKKRCKKRAEKPEKKTFGKVVLSLLPEQKVTGESSLSFMFFFWYIELEKRWLLEGE